MANNEDKYTDHLIEEERRLLILEQNIMQLTKKVESLETSVSGLVEAWKTANGVVSFIKWVAGLATAVVAVIAFIKLGAK